MQHQWRFVELWKILSVTPVGAQSVPRPTGDVPRSKFPGSTNRIKEKNCYKCAAETTIDVSDVTIQNINRVALNIHEYITTELDKADQEIHRTNCAAMKEENTANRRRAAQNQR